MTAFSDSSKPTPANHAARPLSRSDYEAVHRVSANTDVPRSWDAGEPVTVDKIGDFLEIDFRKMFHWMRAGVAMATVLAVLGGAGGAAYGLLSKPRYTVGTDIMINPANLQVVANDLYSQPGQVDNQVLVARSKLRVLTSRNVLQDVVDKLNLANDVEFYDPAPSLMTELLGTNANAQKPDPKGAALENLAKKVDATADETSFVATLSVSAQSVGKAIEISKAMVKSFQDELAKAESSGANRAAGALDDRLAALKHDVQVAEEKVEAYRRDHKLAATQGQLVSSQSMTQLNSQIVAAQSRLIAAQAAYDAAAAAGPNATSSDPAAATALAALRSRAGTLQQQVDALSMTYGSRHPRLVQLRAELNAANGQIGADLVRILASAKSNLAEAKDSLAALNISMNSLKGDVFSDNDSQVALRELERDAASKTSVYESFLSRAHQITEREQIDTTNVQVISTAVPPAGRSWPPRTILLIIAGGILGFMLGMFLSFIRGMMVDMRGAPQRPVVGYY